MVRKGQSLYGTVVDESYRPVVGLEVTLEPSSSEVEDLIWKPEDQTDALGRFTLAGLAPGEYELRGVSGTVEVDERPWQRKTFSVGHPRRLEVEVGVDAVGRLVHLEDCRGVLAHPVHEIERVASDGIAVFENPPRGEFRVTVGSIDADRCADDRGVSVDLRFEAEVRVGVDASGLEPEPHVRVRVVDPEGQPVAGAVVGIDTVGDPERTNQWRGTVISSAATDADGIATLPGVRPEHRSIVVAARPGWFGERVAEEQEIVIELHPTEPGF